VAGGMGGSLESGRYSILPDRITSAKRLRVPGDYVSFSSRSCLSLTGEGAPAIRSTA
jgi:hypothetical protein